MSLYRFFLKASMPARVPSLSDKEIKEANNSVKNLQGKTTRKDPRTPHATTTHLKKEHRLGSKLLKTELQALLGTFLE